MGAPCDWETEHRSWPRTTFILLLALPCSRRPLPPQSQLNMPYLPTYERLGADTGFGVDLIRFGLALVTALAGIFNFICYLVTSAKIAKHPTKTEDVYVALNNIFIGLTGISVAAIAWLGLKQALSPFLCNYSDHYEIELWNTRPVNNKCLALFYGFLKALLFFSGLGSIGSFIAITVLGNIDFETSGHLRGINDACNILVAAGGLSGGIAATTAALLDMCTYRPDGILINPHPPNRCRGIQYATQS